MAPQNPTIIVGHLDSSDLTKSIDKLVKEVAEKTSGMAEDFTQAIDKMKLAMKDFAITQKVSVDLMKEAWRDMSKSFDAMVAAQSGATGGGKGSGKAHAPNTIGALEQEIAEIKQERKEMELNSDELRTQNALLERRKNLYKEQTTSPATKRIDNAMSMSTNKLDEAQKKLRLLEILQRRYAGTTELSVAQQNKLARAIQKTKEQIDKLKPKSLNDVLGMDANSIDQIAAKMRALKMVRIDPNNAAEVKRVGDAYAELKRKQAQLMGQNVQLTHSNNYLAQSFGYIRNRIVYALTLGALTNFVKQLYEIRGQYELLERSLGVLVGSFEKGTQIFNELNEMAIKSPFTLIELGTAAKQLTAYNFAANEVVDTTRRLADISAALGVPMERLTYNLGQIKAQGVLNARDARDFANAGLAIVPMLAKMYTEQKTFGNEMVTTAQVYDMMSKKMVTYSDVLKVLYKVTDEGGKFFDFQAKQADTLRVQMANLTLAYNNMLNEIGSENQGLLTAWVSGLKTLLKNWKEISRAILTLVTTLGTYKAVAAIVSALNSRMFVGSVLVGLRNYILGIKNATGAMATFNAVTKANPIAFLISALVAAIGYFALFNHKVKEASEEVEMFGESAAKSVNKVKTLQKILQGTEETSSTYKKTLSELSQIAKEYGIQIDAEKASRDEANKSAEKTIELIREESAERQRANQLEKARERYETQTGEVKSDFTSALKGLDGWFGTTSKTRKELIDNAEAISDVTSSIIEENIQLVVGKTGDEALSGIKEIKSKISNGLQRTGISSESIEFLFNRADMRGHLRDIINGYKDAAEAQENYNQKTENYYQKSKKITNATMTFTEKVDANARALRNNTEDALSLYNRIYDIVKIAKENHVINFDLKLSAEKPPKWMLDKSLPELQQLAERFTAIAQSGGHVKGYDRESTYERGLMYASAARIKQEEEERNARNKDTKTRTKQSDEIAKAIKNEISLVKELQSAYDTLTKKGDSHANAIAKVQDLYGKTINLLNKDMDKFGLPRLDLSIIKGNNHNEVLAFFEKLRDVLESKGLSNLERMEAVEGVVKEFRLKADTYNLDMITKGLNNELGKLKDEYELAVELDANPEMGNLFADWMGIDMSTLPHTAEEYAKRMTKALNKYLADEKSGIEIGSLLALTDDDLRMFQQRAESGELNQVWVDTIVKNTKEARNALKKENSDIAKDWDSLVQKYSEYEYKIAQVQRNANKERKAFALKYGSNAQKERALVLTTKIDAEKDQAKKQELINQLKQLLAEIAGDDDAKLKIKVAIDQKELEDGAKVAFEEFQKSPEWIVATGDLAGLTDKALGGLISSLEEYKKKAKYLNPKQIKQLNKALIDLYKKQREGNPFKALSIAMMEAKERVSVYEDELKDTQNELDGLTKKQAESFSEERAKKIDLLINRIKDLKQAIKDGLKLNPKDVVEGIGAMIAVAKQASDIFTEMFDSLGVSKEITQQIEGVFTVLDKGIQGAQTGAAIGGQYGAIIGGIVGAFTGLLSVFGGGKDDITLAIERSERSVKQLEIAYKHLEVAIEEAYGSAKWGAEQAAIANKKLQLAELRRQLTLERSRDSKDRDEGKINDLMGQIEDLRIEIEKSIKDITNDLLGISSVGNAAEELVSSMIDAFRKGEDYMLHYDQTFEEMINNMVMKSIVGRVVGDRLQSLWDRVDAVAKEKGEPYQKQIEALMAAKKANEDSMETLNNNNALWNVNKAYFDKYGITLTDKLKQANEKIDEEIKKIQKQYSDAIAPTPEDVQSVRDDAANWRDSVKSEFEAYMELFGIKFGDSADSKQLSSLQQGISQITEVTAQSLEAYANSISQQAYLRNDLLTQIRDAVVGFDMDVQIGTLSEILLQLQSSYQIQMSIRDTLQGWSNASGMAVRVEMV